MPRAPTHTLVVIGVCTGLGIGYHNHICKVGPPLSFNILILIQTETPGSKRGFVVMFPIRLGYYFALGEIVQVRNGTPEGSFRMLFAPTAGRA
jgi:hypothetical protein